MTKILFTCLIAELILLSVFTLRYLSGCSPPSPVFDFPPILFIAKANVVWASSEILPKLMAPKNNFKIRKFLMITCIRVSFNAIKIF